MKPTLLLLAAGMGSRYGGLKQIDPVGPNGEILMDYAIYDALQAGFGKVVFVIRRDFAEAFKERVAKRFGTHVAVDYAYQEYDDLPEGFKPPEGRSKPWGTAHAVRAARKVINEPFAAINADDFYGRESFQKLGALLTAASATHRPNSPEQLAMVGYQLRHTLSAHGSVARGICNVDEQGYLRSVTEHTAISGSETGAESLQSDGSVVALSGDETVSMNLWGFTPAFFTLMERHFSNWLASNGSNLKAEWYITLVVDALVAAGSANVHVLTSASRWFGVTYREDRERTVAAIKELIAAGVYPERLWQ